MNTHRIAVIIVVALAWFAEPSVGRLQAAEPVAVQVTLETPRIDDTARILRITNRSGTFKLRSPAASLALNLNFYKQGRKVPNKSISVALQHKGAALTGEGKFSVQLADLDYLPLGGADPGQMRAYVGVALGNSAAAYTADIAKNVFDVSQITGTQPFGLEGSTAEEVPLFWITARTGAVQVSPATPASVIAAHPDADLLIATLKLK